MTEFRLPCTHLFCVRRIRHARPPTTVRPSTVVMLARMVLYKVNTGCREQEVPIALELGNQGAGTWDELFLIPLDFGGRRPNSVVKNREDRLVVLNDVAKSVIEAQRGLHSRWVFPY